MAEVNDAPGKVTRDDGWAAPPRVSCSTDRARRRRFTGAELVELGVAYEVIDDASVLARARTLTAELADHPPDGLRSIKRAPLRHFSQVCQPPCPHRQAE